MKNPFRIFLSLIFLSSTILAQNPTKIDSLNQQLSKASRDTNKFKLLTQLGNQYKYLSPDTALSYYNEALELAENMENEKFIVNIANEIGTAKRILGSYEEAIFYYMKALKISEKNNDKTGMSRLYGNLGIIYIEQGVYDKAIEFCMKALKTFEELGNKNAMAKCYTNIGIVHADQGSVDQAIEYFLKALHIKEEIGDKRGIAMLNGNIGILHAKQNEYNSAYEYYMKSLSIFEEIGDKREMSISYDNVGVVHKERGELKKAMEYYSKSLAINQELGDKKGIATSYANMASLNFKLADKENLSKVQKSEFIQNAVELGNKSLQIGLEIKSWPIIQQSSEMLMGIFKELGNYKKSLEFSEIYIAIKDSMFNEDKTNIIQEMQTKYETEKKLQRIKLQKTQLAKKDAEIKQQKTLRNALIGGLGAFIIIVLLIAYAYIQKRQDNVKITKQKNLINRQKEEITDSIKYAKRIQTAILPPDEMLLQSFPEHFILFKPRDIVSGDFYWMKQINDITIITAADCTGHGVPGAFMSMLGIALLNEIVRKNEITSAGQLLDELRENVKLSLRQTGKEGEAKDGMDMALCVIDKVNHKLQYAGAYNPLYFFRFENGTSTFQEIKADKMPIGIYMKEKDKFTNHVLEIKPGDTIYMFSDGFQDQPGGLQGKKFMTKKFRNLLHEIRDKSMIEQHEYLDKTIEEWRQIPGINKKTHEQIDDILVIGIRI